jgi:proteic killer suppression protein
MIRSFRHKGLKRLFEDDDRSKLPAADLGKIRRILARLDAAAIPQDMEAPDFKLHQLKGNFKGFWAVTVRANWRVVFRMQDGDAFDVDYVDYH